MLGVDHVTVFGALDRVFRANPVLPLLGTLTSPTVLAGSRAHASSR
jgi:hypothetical protein